MRGARPRERVLMVTPHPYPPHPQVQRNVNYLLRQGIELDLVCMASSNLPDWDVADPNLHVYRIRMNHRRSHAVRYVQEYVGFFVLALPIVCRLSLRHRYKVVQVDNLPDPLVYVAFLPRWRGARIVLNVLEHMSELTSARLKLASEHPLVRLNRWMERKAQRWADHILSVSETGRGILLGTGLSSEKVSVIPNSIPPDPGVNWSPTEPPVLVVLTTLVERYGVQVVIRALAELQHAWPGLTLRVLGDGEYKPALIALAAELGLQDRVAFYPFRPWRDAMAEVLHASIGVVSLMPDPYSNIMLPTKLLDYAQHGLPVVCSRLPTIESLFPPDTVGYFEPGDARELAAQIDRLLRHPDEARRQAARARVAIRSVSWDTVGPRYLRALGLQS
jgi:glycosyltransferase involved in cell wall biosynthesis